MVTQQLFFFFFFFFFFHVKLDATNSFPSNTAEGRPIYLKMGHIMRHDEHPRNLISAFVVLCLDSNKILQIVKFIQPDCPQPVSFRKASCRNMYICLSLSFTLQERRTPIVFPFWDTAFCE